MSRGPQLPQPPQAPQPLEALQLEPDVKDALGQTTKEAMEAPDMVDNDAICITCAAAIALLPVIA